MELPGVTKFAQSWLGCPEPPGLAAKIVLMGISISRLTKRTAKPILVIRFFWVIIFSFQRVRVTLNC